MTDTQSLHGRLVALHWPSQTSQATLSVDLNQRQVATAEIEDTSGTTHHVKVQVNWDADSLVGKIVQTSTTEEGTLLASAE